MNRQILAIFIVVVACSITPTISEVSLGPWNVGNWIKKFLGKEQEGITAKVAAITKLGEAGRDKNLPEHVAGPCKPVTDVLKGKYDPNAVAGKWYGVLQSNDIYRQGKPETLNPNRFCVSYDITPTSNGLKVAETSFADEDGKEGKETTQVTLTRTDNATATFRMEGSETGFDFAQLTASKADDYAIWYYNRNNANGTCTLKMAALSRTQNITVDSLLAFHDVVLIKNLKMLNIHPRLFHVDQDSCPKL